MSSVQLRFAQVVAVWPQRRTCECVMMEDGWRVADVPILNWYVSSDTGAWSMHNMERPPDELAAGGLYPDLDKRTVLAVIALVEGRPLCLGFLPHPLTQVAFIEEQQNRDLCWRHPAGTYWQIAPDGSYEFRHTGGAYFRVGVGEQPEDLAPLAANGNWVLPENEAPTITLVTEGFKMRIQPGGDTLIESAGSMTVRYEGSIDIEAGGPISVRTPATVDVLGGDTVTIRTAAETHVTSVGDVYVRTEGGANVLASGDIAIQAAGDVDIVAGGALNMAAVGGVNIFAGGDLSAAALGLANISTVGVMALSGTTIIANTPLFDVVGVEIVDESPEIAAAAILALAIQLEAQLTTVLTQVADLPGAPDLFAAIQPDIAKAQADVIAAAADAEASSEAAEGAGPLTPT